MKLLDQYFEIQDKIYEHFGYKEDWRVIPLEDSREYYWKLSGESYGDEVIFAEEAEVCDNEDGNHYSNEIYTQRHLPKWVYRADDFTMICVNTHTDGNVFLQVFDNSKERNK